MKSILKISLFSTLLLFIVSCTQEKKSPTGILPISGEVEYEVSYSKDVLNDLVVGQFLPKSFTGEYNKNGIKIEAACGFGMVKINMVLSPIDCFVDLSVPDGRFVVPLEQIVIRDSLEEYDTKFVVERNEELVDICGYKSKSMRISINCAEDKSRHIQPADVEIFYAPIEGVDFSIAGIPEFTVPGLITAMKLSSDDSSVMLMLNEVKEKNISDDIFKRPKNASVATEDVLAKMVSSMQ